MSTQEEARVIRMKFAEAVEAPASGHKVIAAAKALRDYYRTLPEIEKRDLIEWVRVRSSLHSFIDGNDTAYYVQIAVPKKGLRRANLEHLERYSSEETGTLSEAHSDSDEYTFNIWKSEWRYIEGFLKQFEIGHRIVSGPADNSPSAGEEYPAPRG